MQKKTYYLLEGSLGNAMNGAWFSSSLQCRCCAKPWDRSHSHQKWSVLWHKARWVDAKRPDIDIVERSVPRFLSPSKIKMNSQKTMEHMKTCHKRLAHTSKNLEGIPRGNPKTLIVQNLLGIVACKSMLSFFVTSYRSGPSIIKKNISTFVSSLHELSNTLQHQKAESFFCEVLECDLNKVRSAVYKHKKVTHHLITKCYNMSELYMAVRTVVV